MRTFAWAVAAVAALCGPAAAGTARGTFAPERFFAGRTHSEGAFVDAEGRPQSRFSGDTVGRRDRDGATTFDQVIRMDDGTVRRRSFRLVRTGPRGVLVTGSEVVGSAVGEIRGPVLRLRSTIRLAAGNPFSDVDFDQTFTAAPDGRSVRNQSTISIFGLTVRRADETFVRLDRPRRRRR